MQSIVGYTKINDAMINETTCEISGVSKVPCHEVSTEDKLPILMQPVWFQWEQLSIELEHPSGVSKKYSSESPLSCTSSTVVLKPVSMVLYAEPLVHTATINSTHISISTDKWIKALKAEGNQ